MKATPCKAQTPRHPLATFSTVSMAPPDSGVRGVRDHENAGAPLLRPIISHGLEGYPLIALARRTIKTTNEEHTCIIMSTLAGRVVGGSVVGPKVELVLKERKR